MPSGGIQVNLRAEQGRDSSGRFISAIESGAEATVMELSALGAGVSRGVAPRRTGALAASIRMFGGGLSGGWSVNVPYSMFQEKGTRAKGRPGQFLTNREDFYAIGPVARTPAVHYMRAGFRAVAARAQGVLESNMP